MLTFAQMRDADGNTVYMNLKLIAGFYELKHPDTGEKGTMVHFGNPEIGHWFKASADEILQRIREGGMHDE